MGNKYNGVCVSESDSDDDSDDNLLEQDVVDNIPWYASLLYFYIDGNIVYHLIQNAYYVDNTFLYVKSQYMDYLYYRYNLEKACRDGLRVPLRLRDGKSIVLAEADVLRGDEKLRNKDFLESLNIVRSDDTTSLFLRSHEEVDETMFPITHLSIEELEKEEQLFLCETDDFDFLDSHK